MVKFVYNNAKNISTSDIPFNFNNDYHFCVFFEDKIDPHLKFHSVNKLVKEPRDLMSIFEQNLLYAQELWKQAYDKCFKPHSYILG